MGTWLLILKSVPRTKMLHVILTTKSSMTKLKNVSLMEMMALHRAMLYEFIDTPSTVAVLSCHASQPVYLIRIVDKGIAISKIEDRFGHTNLEGQHYLKGFYLCTTRSKTLSKLQFTVMKEAVYVMTDEVFETFIEVDENLQMSKGVYSNLTIRTK